jgi:hypothetical protein
MGDFQVTCITKPNPQSSHEHITAIGGTGGGGWKLLAADAIRRIENKTDSFYTLVGGKRAVVAVVKEQNGREYLRTHADGQWNNNLLSLPQCA